MITPPVRRGSTPRRSPRSALASRRCGSSTPGHGHRRSTLSSTSTPGTTSAPAPTTTTAEAAEAGGTTPPPLPRAVVLGPKTPPTHTYQRIPVLVLEIQLHSLELQLGDLGRQFLLLQVQLACPDVVGAVRREFQRVGLDFVESALIVGEDAFIASKVLF